LRLFPVRHICARALSTRCSTCPSVVQRASLDNEDMEKWRAFASHQAAGCALARELTNKHLVEPVVLALSSGGVPVAIEIAKAPKAPLDLVLVRKILKALRRRGAGSRRALGSGRGGGSSASRSRSARLSRGPGALPGDCHSHILTEQSERPMCRVIPERARREVTSGPDHSMCSTAYMVPHSAPFGMETRYV
jgi:hypothetical protein